MKKKDMSECDCLLCQPEQQIERIQLQDVEFCETCSNELVACSCLGEVAGKCFVCFKSFDDCECTVESLIKSIFGHGMEV